MNEVFNIIICLVRIATPTANSLVLDPKIRLLQEIYMIFFSELISGQHNVRGGGGCTSPKFQ